MIIVLISISVSIHDSIIINTHTICCLTPVLAPDGRYVRSSRFIVVIVAAVVVVVVVYFGGEKEQSVCIL